MKKELKSAIGGLSLLVTSVAPSFGQDLLEGEKYLNNLFEKKSNVRGDFVYMGKYQIAKENLSVLKENVCYYIELYKMNHPEEKSESKRFYRKRMKENFKETDDNTFKGEENSMVLDKKEIYMRNKILEEKIKLKLLDSNQNWNANLFIKKGRNHSKIKGKN